MKNGSFEGISEKNHDLEGTRLNNFTNLDGISEEDHNVEGTHLSNFTNDLKNGSSTGCEEVLRWWWFFGKITQNSGKSTIKAIKLINRACGFGLVEKMMGFLLDLKPLNNHHNLVGNGDRSTPPRRRW